MLANKISVYFFVVVVIFVRHPSVMVVCLIGRSFISRKCEMFPWRSAWDSPVTNFLAIISHWFLWFPDRGRKWSCRFFGNVKGYWKIRDTAQINVTPLRESNCCYCKTWKLWRCMLSINALFSTGNKWGTITILKQLPKLAETSLKRLNSLFKCFNNRY